MRLVGCRECRMGLLKIYSTNKKCVGKFHLAMIIVFSWDSYLYWFIDVESHELLEGCKEPLRKEKLEEHFVVYTNRMWPILSWIICKKCKKSTEKPQLKGLKRRDLEILRISGPHERCVEIIPESRISVWPLPLGNIQTMYVVPQKGAATSNHATGVSTASIDLHKGLGLLEDAPDTTPFIMICQ